MTDNMCAEILDLAEVNKTKKKKIKDLTGNKYGKITVLGYVGSIDHQAMWLCQCECGNKMVDIIAYKIGYSKQDSVDCCIKSAKKQALAQLKDGE